MRLLSNLYDDVPSELPQEVMQTLLAAESLRIERIVSHGHASPPDFWYDQAEHEWVLLLAGAARLQWDDGFVDLKPGDFINIPAHRRHRVDWTAPDGLTIWLAVFYSSEEKPVKSACP
jgi:cupin 2 domain-containing protein